MQFTLTNHACPDSVARILETVPGWFGRPESNREYIDAANTLRGISVITTHGITVGVLLIEEHFPHSWEVHLMAVDAAFHGRGIGTALMKATEDLARESGVKLLQVKTLGASHPDTYYAKTRRFYEGYGFIPLEEHDLWGEDTPCLVLVKPL